MTNEQLKCCPYCDELIKYTALKCRFCKSLLYDERGNTEAMQPEKEERRGRTRQLAAGTNKGVYTHNRVWLIFLATGAILLLFVIFYILSAYKNSGAGSSTDLPLQAEREAEAKIIEEAGPYYLYVDVPATSFLHLRSRPGTDYTSLEHLK